MSTGKEDFTLIKQETGDETHPVQAVRGINFAHKSPGGEQEIAYGSLVAPPEYLTSGLTNPTGDFLISLGLSAYKAKVTITSSLGTVLQKSSYTVTDSAIVFKTYVTTLDEVFEVSVPGVISGGQQVVDVRAYNFPGTMLNGTDEFTISPIEASIFPWPFIVFRNGQQVFQADDNDESGDTGNFYILDPDGDGRGDTIKFFAVAIGDEAILVSSIGGVVDAPNISTFGEIDFLAGQLDAVIPTIAALAGVPESNFRAAPARPHLLAFAERILSLEANKQNNLLVGYAQDIKSTAQASITGGITTRDMTNISGDTSFFSVDGSGLLIQPGIIILDLESVYIGCGHNKLYVYDVTNAVYLNPDATMNFDSASTVATASESITLTISVPTKILLRHWTAVGIATGMSGTISARAGDPGNAANSVVAKIKLTKIG